MKISLITFTRTRNYGGILQGFALYNALCRMGHKVQMIDYVTERCDIESEKYIDIYTGKSKTWGKNVITKKIWKLFFYPYLKKTYKQFFGFLESRVELSEPYFSNEELKNAQFDADAFLVGSDQVWNSSFTLNKRMDLPYYLDFVSPGYKKIAYASSFGKTQLSSEEGEATKALLEKFANISVREETGAEILKGIGLDSYVVADPTLLLSVEEWEKHVSKLLIRDRYMMLFQIHPRQSLLELAKKVAREKKLKLIVVSANRMDKYKIKSKVIVAPKIDEWLSYIKHAEVVMTDSFHTSIFSIIFERNFIVDLEAANNSRILNLLNIVDLIERGINSYDATNCLYILNTPINYDEVNKKVLVLKNESLNWLEKALH